jgi:hypothetical protein
MIPLLVESVEMKENGIQGAWQQEKWLSHGGSKTTEA